MEIIGLIVAGIVICVAGFLYWLKRQAEAERAKQEKLSRYFSREVEARLRPHTFRSSQSAPRRAVERMRTASTPARRTDDDNTLATMAIISAIDSTPTPSAPSFSGGGGESAGGGASGSWDSGSSSSSDSSSSSCSYDSGSSSSFDSGSCSSGDSGGGSW